MFGPTREADSPEAQALIQKVLRSIPRESPHLSTRCRRCDGGEAVPRVKGETGWVRAGDLGMHNGRGRRGPWPFRGAKIKPVDTEAPRTQRNLSLSSPLPTLSFSLYEPLFRIFGVRPSPGGVRFRNFSAETQRSSNSGFWSLGLSSRL